MKQLNGTELQIMKYLWLLKKGFMKDIVEQFPEPRPAYTTISTLLSRMCTKEYIGFNKLGRDKHYYPILKKSDYFSSQLKGMIENFFDNSATQFASFFTQKTELDETELKELQQLIEQQLENKKKTKVIFS